MRESEEKQIYQVFVFLPLVWKRAVSRHTKIQEYQTESGVCESLAINIKILLSN